MKKIILLLALMGLVSNSCNSVKNNVSNSNVLLSGSWELSFISGSRITFEGLYPEKKPSITFDTINNITWGITGCNNFSGSYDRNGNAIKFAESMAVTRMICEEMQGEMTFLSVLYKINKWSIKDEGKTLELKMDDVVLMRFTKI